MGRALVSFMCLLELLNGQKRLAPLSRRRRNGSHERALVLWTCLRPALSWNITAKRRGLTQYLQANSRPPSYRQETDSPVSKFALSISSYPSFDLCRVRLQFTPPISGKRILIKFGTGWFLRNRERHDLYFSLRIIRVIKSRRMRWAGHVAQMEGEEEHI
jgi:hypothetical protein